MTIVVLIFRILGCLRSFLFLFIHKFDCLFFPKSRVPYINATYTLYISLFFPGFIYQNIIDMREEIPNYIPTGKSHYKIQDFSYYYEGKSSPVLNLYFGDTSYTWEYGEQHYARVIKYVNRIITTIIINNKYISLQSILKVIKLSLLSLFLLSSSPSSSPLFP